MATIHDFTGRDVEAEEIINTLRGIVAEDPRAQFILVAITRDSVRLVGTTSDNRFEQAGALHYAMRRLLDD